MFFYSILVLIIIVSFFVLISLYLFFQNKIKNLDLYFENEKKLWEQEKANLNDTKNLELLNIKNSTQELLESEKEKLKKIEEEKKELNQKIEGFYKTTNDLEKQLTALQTDLKNEKDKALEYQEQRKLLKEELKNLSYEQLNKNNEQFKTKVEDSIKHLNINFKNSFELQKNETEKLKEYQKKIDDIMSTTSKDFHSVKNLVSSFEKINKSYMQLMHPSNVKHRGTWHELGVEILLKEMHFQENTHYKKQFVVGEDEKGIIDYLLLLPENIVIIMDCKFPSIPFLNESINGDVKKFDQEKFKQQIKSLLDNLIRKEYPKKLRETNPEYKPMDYQFIFSPSQLTFDFIISDNALRQYFYNHKLIFVSGTTLMSYFVIFRDAWKVFDSQNKIQENIKVIQNIASNVGNVYNTIRDLGDTFEAFQKSYNRLVGFYNKQNVKEFLIEYDEIKKSKIKKTQLLPEENTRKIKSPKKPKEISLEEEQKQIPLV